MANTTFPKGSQRILSAGINFLTDTIKATLLPDTYTFSTAHEFVSDLGARIGTDQTLTSKSVTGGVLDAEDLDFGILPPGNTAKVIAIYKETGNTSTAPVLFYIDVATGLPFATNGGALTIPWDSGVKKIARLYLPFFPKGAEKTLSASINFSTDVLKAVALPADYAYDAGHEFLDDVGTIIGTPVTLTNKSVTGGVFDADDIDLGALAGGSTLGSVAIFKETGNAATSPLLLRITDITGFPLLTGGSNVTVRWSNGAARIISLIPA